MAENKRYYWLKLMDDFFSQPKIKKLRRIAGGDTYTIIYLKLQLMSLMTDAKIYFENIEDNIIDELALKLDEEPDNVRVTIQYLIAQGLMEEVEAGEFLLPETSILIGSETKDAIRKRIYRNGLKRDNVPSVSQERPPEIEKDIEIEIEKDIEDTLRTSEPPAEPAVERLNYNIFLETWNEKAVSYPKVKQISDRRKKAIKAKVTEFGQDQVLKAFEMLEDASFLKKWGRCDMDWVLKGDHILRILEGKYNDDYGSTSQQHTAGDCVEYGNDDDMECYEV